MADSPSNALPSSRWNVLLEANPGGNDYMTTGQYAEYQNFPGLGQNFYVPNSPSGLPATAALYRLSNGPDHMASLQAGEAGYTTEGVLGYPLISGSALPGLTAIHRFLKASDHATGAAGTGIAGYTDEGSLGAFGYMRYRTNPTALQAVSGGGLNVQSDLIAGGAVASWRWNNIEFINTADYGRYLQADIFFNDAGGVEGAAPTFNPIEAGDVFTSGSDPLLYRHGAPCVLANVSGGVQQTRAVPLDFLLPQTPLDKDINSVRLYHGSQIGKDLTLGWNGLSQVAQYRTVFALAAPITAFDVEVPTAYLNSQFNRFWTFDVANNVFAEVTSGLNWCNGEEYQWFPASGRGGVIISTSDGAAAMGAYAVTSHANTGSRITRFTLTHFPTCGDCSKWAVRGSMVPLAQGENSFSAYIATGTLDQAKSLMQALYSAGAS
ncbi:hypothetical protein AB6806_19485 [Bosea sp. RCC_152_1]|uniref:hypothetical protein n=1 Tax=Bosea sp. RCC_152_1 TaxID=3239228 RepID=UPI0035252EF6